MNAPVVCVLQGSPSAAPTRPALRYHGGKWRLAPWIVAHFPAHRTYVEPFGGAASVLLRKPRAYAEVYNDLDDDVVNLFRVLRDAPRAAELQRLIALTPFAREEFEFAYVATDDAIERARRLMVRSFMGHGASGVRKHRTGFRADVYRSGTTPAADWRAFPPAVDALAARLAGVVIEHRDWRPVLERYDRPDVLFYVDPPYLFGTRSQKRLGNDLYHGYRHELDDAGHAELLARLATLGGMVVLSGYPSPLYDAALPDWLRVACAAMADRAAKRTEVLWINPAAAARLPQRGLFDQTVPA